MEVTAINGSQIIIMEYIEGATLGERLLGDMEQANYYIDIFIREQLAIHQASIQETSNEWMLDKLSRQITFNEYLPECMKKSLLGRLASMKFEPRLCHGDFHPFNVIMYKDRMTILDWADSSLGDIRADVFRTFLLLSRSSTNIAQKYLRRYCLLSGISEEEVFKWAPIVAGARLSEEIRLEDKKFLRKIVEASFI